MAAQAQAQAPQTGVPGIPNQIPADLAVLTDLSTASGKGWLLLEELGKIAPTDAEIGEKAPGLLAELTKYDSARSALVEGMRTGEPPVFRQNSFRAEVLKALKPFVNDDEDIRYLAVEELEDANSGTAAREAAVQVLNSGDSITDIPLATRVLKLFSEGDQERAAPLKELLPHFAEEIRSEIAKDLKKEIAEAYRCGEKVNNLRLKALVATSDPGALKLLRKIAAQDFYQRFDLKDALDMESYSDLPALLITQLFTGAVIGGAIGLLTKSWTPVWVTQAVLPVIVFGAIPAIYGVVTRDKRRIFNPEMGRDAIELLRKFAPSDETEKAFLGIIADQDASAELRELVTESLKYSLSPEMQRKSAKKLGSRDAEVRRATLQFLTSSLSDPIAIAAVEKLTRDPEKDIRLLAYQALRKSRESSAGQ